MILLVRCILYFYKNLKQQFVMKLVLQWCIHMLKKLVKISWSCNNSYQFYLKAKLIFIASQKRELFLLQGCFSTKFNELKDQLFFVWDSLYTRLNSTSRHEKQNLKNAKMKSILERWFKRIQRQQTSIISRFKAN